MQINREPLRPFSCVLWWSWSGETFDRPRQGVNQSNNESERHSLEDMWLGLTTDLSGQKTTQASSVTLVINFKHLPSRHLQGSVTNCPYSVYLKTPWLKGRCKAVKTVKTEKKGHQQTIGFEDIGIPGIKFCHIEDTNNPRWISLIKAPHSFVLLHPTQTYYLRALEFFGSRHLHRHQPFPSGTSLGSAKAAMKTTILPLLRTPVLASLSLLQTMSRKGRTPGVF